MISEIKQIFELNQNLSKEEAEILFDNIYFNYIKIVRTNNYLKNKNDINKELLENSNKIIWNVENIINNKVIINIKSDVKKDEIKLNLLEFSMQSHLNSFNIWNDKLSNETNDKYIENIKKIIDFHKKSYEIIKKSVIE